MDFGALPPEINSGRMYLGPGPASLLAAAAGWESLATELTDGAGGYQAVIASLTDASWLGPASMEMAAAVMPYISWMATTAEHCGQVATQATAAAAAFDTAHAMTVPPPLVAANRARLMALIATNIFGQNTPAIMSTESEYSEMWAQDAAAMYSYAANSASASALSPLPSPPQLTNPDAGHVGAVTQAAAARSGGSTTTGQFASLAPQAFSTPSSSSSTGVSQAAMGTGASLGSSGASAPLSSLSSLTGATSKGATKSAGTGAGAASGVASALAAAPAAGGTTGEMASDAAGLGADGAGLIADGGGIGMDLDGLGMDYQGLALDYAGAGSISAAEGSGGIGNIGGAAGSGNPAPFAGLGQSASASVGQASSLSTLSVPPSWAATVSSINPLPALNASTVPGGMGAAHATSPAPTVSKLPLGGMVGRGSEGAVQRVGIRVSLIPHSPVAG